MIWRLLAGLVLTATLAGACAADREDLATVQSSPAQPNDSDEQLDAGHQGVLDRLAAGLVSLAVPTDRYGPVLAAGCDAWVPGAYQGDSASFSQWIHSLFVSGGARYSSSDVDAAITDACSQHRNDPAAFLTDALGDLDMSVDDLLSLATDACGTYRQGRIANIDDPFAPQAIDPLVADVLADANIERADAAAAVDDFCDVPDPDSIELPPSILPDPVLTPGAVTADFDIGAACADPTVEPAIPEELRLEVIDRYRADSFTVEVLRLIPTGLGGATTLDNLFPVPIDEHPGAGDKAGVDQLVIGLVCNDEVSIEDARQALSIDWPIAYSSLNR